MNNGYVKLYRKTLDNPIIMHNTDNLAIWVYLLMKATHKKRDVIFDGRRTTLEPGQFITGRGVIAKELKVSSSKVQRFLNRLEIEQQIEQQTCPRNRLITIVNWNDYQQSEQVSEQQVNNKRTTSEQQVNTNKNVKNDKNERMKEKRVSVADISVPDFQQQFPAIDVKAEFEKFTDYIEAHGKKYKNYVAAFRNWLKSDIPKKKRETDQTQETAERLRKAREEYEADPMTEAERKEFRETMNNLSKGFQV